MQPQSAEGNNLKKIRSLVVFFLILSVSLSTIVPCVLGAEDSWMTLEPMPTARSGFGVAVVDGKIHAIGGTNGSLLGTNEMYDPATDTWTTKQPMPTARTGLALAVYQNKIYAIGGIIGESDPVSSGYTGVTEVYDPLTDTWETKEPMPTARGDLCANVVDEKIYLIEGRKHGEVFPFYQNPAVNEVYCPSNDSWSTKTSIPTSTFVYASAVVDNKIYVMGGFSRGHLNQIYNPETDTWSYGKEVPTAVISAAAGATTGELAPKRIYVFSGMGNQTNNATNLTQVYDPENDVWTTGTPIPTPRWSLGVAVVNDELYAIGGYDGETYLAANEKYTPAGYIPEFPLWTSLLITLVAAVTVTVVYRRKLQNGGRSK
jgi:N-acetylneuraminic acid mutarotase